ncbi:hypothetical protein LTR62_003974 [Meristemomyces frigidus]|uniref:Asteroid domain-containing protein n=1 Tax=Meristemomyces frigidus TaxID=1508187 RepID=A0AAN7TR86_9PEZI|nr:hypothetical protein LTR62_003974 [Meristemomyces frigidus]
MGIERLFTRLQAAGFIQNDRKLGEPDCRTHHHAVIDGPAFAYFVNGRLKLKKAAEPGIGSVVAYTEYAAESLRWLQLFENDGLDIHAIYFDGALPVTKRPVRIKRLQQHAEQLHAYKLRHDHLSRKVGAPDLVTCHAALPEPSFIVPAVREALSNSAYHDRIFVVPGEADNFCVAAAGQLSEANKNELISIFTNDSDLAVFESGPSTRIVMLSSMETTGTVLTASSCWPSRIAKSIRSENLFALAYHMQLDPYVSVARVQARLEHGDQPTDRGFSDFVAQYSSAIEQVALGLLQTDPRKRRALLELDARLAEFVCQVRDLAIRADTPYVLRSAETAIGVDVYLPFLIDDPSKASAWHIGARLREAAYTTILSYHGSPPTMVYEYKRAGNNVTARKIVTKEHADLPDQLAALLTSLSHTIEADTLATNVDRWRYAIVQTLLWDFMDTGTTLPTAEDLAHVLLGRRNLHWEHVRLSAQYQACFYSLRMLRQSLRYVACGSDGAFDLPADERHSARALEKLLNGLPGIAEFLVPSDIDMKVWLDLLRTCIAEISGIDDTTAALQVPARKKRKMKSKNVPSVSDGQAVVSGNSASEKNRARAGGVMSSRNIFAALGT